MRSLHVDTGRELRGGQRQVLLLLSGSRAAGEECTLLARAASPLFVKAGQAGIRVYPATWHNVWRYSQQVDLVHAHDAHAHTLALTARAPLLVSRRVAFPIKSSLLSQWKYQRPVRFLAVSQFVAHELERAGIAKDKIDVVYDGVDLGVHSGVFDVTRPAIALASSDPAKGRALIEEAAHLAGLHVTYSNDLTSDLKRASMFVYITHSEGLGSAALLAMAMGIPVIASDVGGLPEVLGQGKAGLLTANDPQKIAAAMRRLREDSTLAETLVERGKKRVAELFTAQQMVESTLASYRRVLGA